MRTPLLPEGEVGMEQGRAESPEDGGEPLTPAQSLQRLLLPRANNVPFSAFTSLSTSLSDTLQSSGGASRGPQHNARSNRSLASGSKPTNQSPKLDPNQPRYKRVTACTPPPHQVLMLSFKDLGTNGII